MKKIIFTLISSVLILFTANTDIFAVPAYPGPIETEQPDGTKITLFNKGDEFYNWLEDSQGYTVIKDTDTRQYFYAQKDFSGRLIKSQLVAGRHSPSRIAQKHLKDDILLESAQTRAAAFTSSLQKIPSYRKFHTSKLSSETNKTSKAPAEPAERKNLVLLIEFSEDGMHFDDMDHFKGKSEQEIIRMFNDLFNGENYTNIWGAEGSVKNYFSEISYGKIKMESFVYPHIIRIDSYKNYSDSLGKQSFANFQTMLRKQLTDIDKNFNFKDLWPGSTVPEGFTVIHSGGGAENGDNKYIWSHQGFITPVTLDGITFSSYHTEPAGRGKDGNGGITPIGVICHETTHFFGAPDLYDTTYNSKGLGNFCLMAGGNWNGSGDIPAHPCAWIKFVMGWIAPFEPETGINEINTSAADTEKNFYIIESQYFPSDAEGPLEYFLIENRQAYGFDRKLPGSKRGLLIHHIDETKFDPYNTDTTKNNNNYRRYLADIEEADGTSDWIYDHLAQNQNSGLDSDYFRADTVTTFRDSCINSPNSKSYDGYGSGIVISNISSSGPKMTFYFKRLNFEIFIDELDENGVKFLNSVMNYSNYDKNTLKALSKDEQGKIDRYFNFTSSENAATDTNNMGSAYFKFKNRQEIFAMNMTKVSADYANTINKLNRLLGKLNPGYSRTGVSLTSAVPESSVGNISEGNNSPLKQYLDTAVTPKRFTSAETVTKIKEYNENLGCLIYSFDKMNENTSYDIIRITDEMDLSKPEYSDYSFIAGDKSIHFGSLSEAAVYPNPARNGEVNFINLPTENTEKLTIEIYTVTGRLVHKFSLSDMEYIYTGNRKLKWNCTNSSGTKVAPGVYIALLRTDSEKKKIKFAIIR